MTAEQRKAEFEKVSAEFEAWKAKGLKLNMARGRPGKEQLDLVVRHPLGDPILRTAWTAT